MERWGEVTGREEGNLHSGNFLLRQCPVLTQAGGGGEIGRRGAVALLEGTGEDQSWKLWATSTNGFHSRAGGRSWLPLDLVGRGRQKRA